jgi:hypothetical protein
LLGRAQLLGEKGEGLPDVLHSLLEDAPLAVVEASVTRARGTVGSG